MKKENFYYGIENFSLTEEEKQKAVQLSCEGDIHGLEYIFDIVKKRTNDSWTHESLLDVVKSVMALNRMVAFYEDFSGVHCNYESQIENLYYEMKWTLFELVGISSEDFEKYEN